MFQLEKAKERKRKKLELLRVGTVPFSTAEIDFLALGASSNNWKRRHEGFEPDMAVDFEAHPACIT